MLVKKGQHSKVPLVAVKCQYICNLGLEDQYKCLVTLSDEEWRYCKDHRESGPEQYKALTNGPYVDDHRDIYKDDEEYRHRRQMEQFRVRHCLTEPQLKERVTAAQTLRDHWPSARDDQHDLARSILQALKGLFLYDPFPLPTVIDFARSSVHALIDQLARRLPTDFIANRLRAYCLEFDCSIGQELSSRRAFGPLGKRIVAAQEAWRDQGDLINLIMALCIHADFCRARFFLDPDYPKHLADAARWLDGALSVLGCCPNQSELDVLRVRHNCIQGKIRLKFDQGAKADELEDEIELLRKLAADIAIPKISYLTACYESEWAIYAGETDQAAEYLTRVDELLPQIGINPFSLREYTLRLKTVLAHKQERFDERDTYFHEYDTLFGKESTIHGYHGLEELRQLCGNPPKPFETRPRLYVNFMFTCIQEDRIRF
jgi:hypothetical protein